MEMSCRKRIAQFGVCVAVASKISEILERGSEMREKRKNPAQENCIKLKLHFMMYNSAAFACILSSRARL